MLPLRSTLLRHLQLTTQMRFLSRRAFVGALAAAIPTASFIRHAHAEAVKGISRDASVLQALGEAVLPSELDEARIASTVRGFQRWIAGYREGTELLHGYGTSKLEQSGPTPATRWATQLDALDATARRTHGHAFAALTVTQRRALIQSDLNPLKADRIPAIGRAPHVALALLAHFYGSVEATDLCYDASISRQSCRPLASSTRKPLPLAPTRRA